MNLKVLGLFKEADGREDFLMSLAEPLRRRDVERFGPPLASAEAVDVLDDESAGFQMRYLQMS